MANTVIQLKKSSTPSAIPASLEFGELALNYADGKLYYKNTNSQIAEISGSGGPSGGNAFGTVNANSVLIIADTAGDVLNLEAGQNITIVGDAINDKITISATATDISPAFNQANTALSTGQAAFSQANTARTHANAAFNQANSALTVAQNAFGEANTKLSNTTGTFAGSLTVSNEMFIEGNVGIGTTSPTQKLHVIGNILASGSIDCGTQFLGLATDTAAAPSFSFTGDTNTGMFRPGTDILAFSTNGVEELRIDAAGNVGISITNPTSLLHVNGTANITSSLTAASIELGHPSDTTLARSSAGNVTIEGNIIYRAGGTDVPVADGGTGASDAANARINLLGTSYALANIVYLTSGTNATYTPPAGVRAVYAEVVGGGGGGGGVDGQGSGTSGVSGSGGGGGYSAVLITDLNQTFKYTIGLGGAGGAAGANPGSGGGTSIFYGGASGTTILAQATGGSGGTGGTAAVTQASGRASGGVGSIGQLNLRGSSANWGRVLNGIWAIIPQAGAAPFFGGGVSGASSVSVDATNFGQGGSGTLAQNTTDNYAGGSGADGVVRITEYY